MRAGNVSLGRSRATDIGHGPQCCGSSPFSISDGGSSSQQKAARLAHPAASHQQRCDGTVNICFTDHRYSLVTQECIAAHGMCRSHSAIGSSTVWQSPRIRTFPPDASSPPSEQQHFPAHPHRRRFPYAPGSTGQLLPPPSALLYLSDLVCQLRHWNRRQLNVELFSSSPSLHMVVQNQTVLWKSAESECCGRSSQHCRQQENP